MSARPSVTLTRRYRFPAAHVLTSPELSEEENRRIFGKCANPAGHGHDYGVEITVAGPVDPATGHILSPERLDALFDERVRAHLSHRMLNELEAFRDLVPTAENIARVVHEALDAAVASERAGAGARLQRVRVTETSRNTFDYGEP